MVSAAPFVAALLLGDLDEHDLPPLDHLLDLVVAEGSRALMLGFLELVAADRLDDFGLALLVVEIECGPRGRQDCVLRQGVGAITQRRGVGIAGVGHRDSRRLSPAARTSALGGGTCDILPGQRLGNRLRTLLVLRPAPRRTRPPSPPRSVRQLRPRRSRPRRLPADLEPAPAPATPLQSRRRLPRRQFRRPLPANSNSWIARSPGASPRSATGIL